MAAGGVVTMMSWPAFQGMWLVMMTAMMTPAAYPMVLQYARIQGDRDSAVARRVSVTSFVLGYIVIWWTVGTPIFALLARAPMQGFGSPVRGIALLVAGAFQLTPLKSHCLILCRSPMTFLIHSWRDGTRGALVMGARHGAFCVGCCWGLILVLAMLGVMNPWWMIAGTVVIVAERRLPSGILFSKVLGWVMIGAGGLLLARSWG